jgi:hypothetical protein
MNQSSPSAAKCNDGLQNEVTIDFNPSNTAIDTFSLTHPKNYLGVPLAISTPKPAEILIPQHLVKMAGEAKAGAEALGLITRQGKLTDKGTDFVTTAFSIFGSEQRAFEQIANSTTSRFINAIPQLKQETQAIFSQYPPTTELVTGLSEYGQLTLPDLTTKALTTEKENLTSYILANNPEHPIDKTLNSLNLGDTDTYSSQFTYQFKSLLCHAGIITTAGSDTTNLDPQTDVWGLADNYTDSVKTDTLAAGSMEGEL